MGKRYVLVDDFDGKELPEDTDPVHLSLGRTTYALYLSEKNHGKLLEALNPFIESAETVATNRVSATRSSSTASSGDKEKLKKVREWAIASNYEYTNAKGERTTLGDRGRIPAEVIEAYEKAN